MSNTKKKVYLDTTIPSYFFDTRKDVAPFCKITKAWWENESQNYDLWLSDETLAELAEGNYPKKNDIINFVKNINVLPRNEEVLEIAKVYLQHQLMPNVLKGDVIHLAYSSYYNIDFLLTWNCIHLANANKKQHIRWLNAKLNLTSPDIITPLELITEENDYE